MLLPPFPETYAAVADSERALARARAEHRAPRPAAAVWPLAAAGADRGGPAVAGRLARAVGSLRRVLRPAHA